MISQISRHHRYIIAIVLKVLIDFKSNNHFLVISGTHDFSLVFADLVEELELLLHDREFIAVNLLIKVETWALGKTTF